MNHLFVCGQLCALELHDVTHHTIAWKLFNVHSRAHSSLDPITSHLTNLTVSTDFQVIMSSDRQLMPISLEPSSVMARKIEPKISMCWRTDDIKSHQILSVLFVLLMINNNLPTNSRWFFFPFKLEAQVFCATLKHELRT